MRSTKPALTGLAIGVYALSAGSALGQSAGECQPAWRTDIGNPGVSSGYVGEYLLWDDGNGERVYAGGSFANIGGAGAELLGQYDPDTDTWTRPGGGLDRGNTNGFVTSMEVFQNTLIVGGFFNNAAGVADTQSLAAWDGKGWSSLGGQMSPPDAVWGMTVGDIGDGERLIAVGSFGSMAGVTGTGLAQYDGKGWQAIGGGAGVDGAFNPTAFDAVVYDDGGGAKLYVCGRFDSVDGVAAESIARFNGTSWEQVGAGIASTRFTFGLERMIVWDDGNGEALYTVGYAHTINGQGGSWHVLKWDGVSWSGVGQNLGGGRSTNIRAFDDGSGETLYITGSGQVSINNFGRLDGGTWTSALGGVSGGSGFSLAAIGSDLYVGGSFDTVGLGTPASGAAIIEGCAGGGDDCPADWDGNGIVNAADVGAFLSDYFLDIANGTVVADFNGDGVTNAADVGAYLSEYFASLGACP